MSNKRISDSLVWGFGILGVLFAIWMVLPAGETTIRMPKAESARTKQVEPGSDMPDEARDALYPETVNMIDKAGKVWWTPVDRWRSAYERGDRFVDTDQLDVDDGVKRFKLTGREVNALLASGRFGILWKFHGPRRKVE